LFNRILNRDLFDRLMNNLVDSTSRFFDRNYKPSNPVQDDPDSVNSFIQLQYQQEWDLNQGVSDIMIKDIKLSINWLLPDIFINALSNFKNRIILYFYLDEIDEKETNTESASEKIQKHLLSGARVKTIDISRSIKNRITAKVVAFNAVRKLMIRKLEIFLCLEPDPPVYYLIGKFNPGIYETSKNDSDTIRGPDHVKLTSSYPFHKRN